MLGSREDSSVSEQAVGIIPARLGSTRFPAKVLADATGQPLIQHVYEAARRAAMLTRVVVATDDHRVEDAVAKFGGECVMTSTTHPNGTSRLAEATAKLSLSARQLIVNVQGDEPELDPGTIDAAVRALLEAERHPGGRAMVGTAATPFGAAENPCDPNCVKVVRSLDGLALYFSRSRIPFDRDAKGGADAACLRHIGVYVYRRQFLEQYAAMEPTPLERAEQLEQLRVLQRGWAIGVALIPAGNAGGPGIDTPEQYQAFVERWKRQQTG